jgi:hypothetical protein
MKFYSNNTQVDIIILQCKLCWIVGIRSCCVVMRILKKLLTDFSLVSQVHFFNITCFRSLDCFIPEIQMLV